MNRRRALLALGGLPMALQALDLGAVSGALGGDLTGLLTRQLGVTDNQAKGGLGAMLTLAKEKLPSADFTKIANLVPGASKYMSLAKTLGAVAGPLKNLGGLNAALGKLGMNPDTVAKFVPTVTNSLGTLGGDTVKTLLGSVFK